MNTKIRSASSGTVVGTHSSMKLQAHAKHVISYVPTVVFELVSTTASAMISNVRTV